MSSKSEAETLVTSEQKSEFAEFQKSEYEHIAEAHFKSIEAISYFFRYYLLVMSLPISVLAALFGIASRDANFDKAAVSVIGLASPFLIAVGVVGFCMMVYIVNMKMDAVLYSRVVNSVRKFFYDGYNADHANKLLMRLLPQTTSEPTYRDISFWFVILAFAILDVSYLGVGFHLSYKTLIEGAASVKDLSFVGYSTRAEIIFLSNIALAFAAHFFVYWGFSQYREFAYLRSSAIGIDIDGVLNMHREKFCEMAESKLQKKIHPDEIKVLPVHQNVKLSAPISRNEEIRIFNDPGYWLDMPVMDGAADAIRTIKNSFLLPVHIFTHRPWPDLSIYDSENRKDVIRREWRNAANEILKRVKAKECVRLWVRIVTMLRYRQSILYVTKYWLRGHGIMFDSLLVEKGNENIVYSRGRYENRFNYAKRRKIRFFVEDDWVKALKLSYICDIVFLVNHPYNEATAEDLTKHADETIVGQLPANVVRVKSWGQLKKLMTQLV